MQDERIHVRRDPEDRTLREDSREFLAGPVDTPSRRIGGTTVLAPNRAVPLQEGAIRSGIGRWHRLNRRPQRVVAIRRGRKEVDRARIGWLGPGPHAVLHDEVRFQPGRAGPGGYVPQAAAAIVPAPEQVPAPFDRLGHRRFDDMSASVRPLEARRSGDSDSVNDDLKPGRIGCDRGRFQGLPVQSRHAVDVSRRQSRRGNAHPWRDGFEHVAAIPRVALRVVVHHRSVVVGPEGRMFGRIRIVAAWVEVLVEDRHVVVTVITLVLVPQSHGMADLMHNGIYRTAVRGQRDLLLSAHHAHLRPAIPGHDVRESHVVRLCRARYEGQDCLFVPVADRHLNVLALLEGDIAVDDVRNGALGPKGLLKVWGEVAPLGNRRIHGLA